MNLCSDDHDEVCFEGRSCPVCEKAKELSAVEDELAKANDHISDLEQELAEADTQ